MGAIHLALLPARPLGTPPRGSTHADITQPRISGLFEGERRITSALGDVDDGQGNFDLGDRLAVVQRLLDGFKRLTDYLRERRLLDGSRPEVF